MASNTIVYIICIAIVAFIVAGFQYLYKAKTSTKNKLVFAFLRFLSLFLLGVLLVNPKVNKKVVTNVKPNLVVAIDNSKSIPYAKQSKQVQRFISELKQSNLSEKFTIDYFTFGNRIAPLHDSVTFTEKQTNISKIFPTFKEVYSDAQAPTIVVTDGNQTFGHDYVVTALNYQQPIYPVAVGDSVLKQDVLISSINHNKYSFLGNEFPLEITLRYIGQKSVNQQFNIFKNNTIVYSNNLFFDAKENTQVLNITLPATKIGKQKYTAHIAPLVKEENTKNNSRNFTVDVIDERTNVLIISDITHPDIGMFKKAIESNQQRKVTLGKPSDIIAYNKYQLILLYQPSSAFKNVFSQLNKFEKIYLVVTGLQTDWQFLNAVQNKYKRQVINKSQEYLASINNNFTLFQTPELQITTFPPLLDAYGTTVFSTNAHPLLNQTINGVATGLPLLTFFENNNQRQALLLGEGIWKWRAQSYLNTQSFENFDAYIGKIIQYLASNTKKERFTIDVKDVFMLGDAKLYAHFFDKNYVLEPNVTISAQLTNTTLNKKYVYNFLFKNNSYELNLNNLPAGNYVFELAAQGIKKSGGFEIEDFDIEAQFVNPNLSKLTQLASGNTLYYLDQYKKLFSDIENNENYKPIQKVTSSSTPIIKWKILLAILLGLLTFEWLLRKYNGLT